MVYISISLFIHQFIYPQGAQGEPGGDPAPGARPGAPALRRDEAHLRAEVQAAPATTQPGQSTDGVQETRLCLLKAFFFKIYALSFLITNDYLPFFYSQLYLEFIKNKLDPDSQLKVK